MAAVAAAAATWRDRLVTGGGQRLEMKKNTRPSSTLDQPQPVVNINM